MGPMSALSWLNLVRKSSGVADGVEGLAEVIGKGVGGGDGLSPGPDLDLAVAAGGLDVGLDGVALAVVDGPVGDLVIRLWR
jgi:hypothetical protein